jgi:hypothetical protein
MRVNPNAVNTKEMEPQMMAETNPQMTQMTQI